MSHDQPRPVRRRPGGAQGGVTPLYHQIYLVLRERLHAGEFPPGRPLPGEHRLAAQFGVSRVTVRRTLEALVREGLVRRCRGAGTFPVVTAPGFENRFNIGGLLGRRGVDDADAAEMMHGQTLSVDHIVAPPEIGVRFGTPALVRVVRRRHVGRTPYTLMTGWLRQDIAALAGHDGLLREPLPALIEAAGYRPAHAEQAITATAADARVAKLLEVPFGAPLILMRTLFRDRGDAPLLYIEALFRPDRYEYRTVLERPEDSPRWRDPA